MCRLSYRSSAQQGLFWVAGLIYPGFSVGIVIGNSLSPYVVQHAQHRKHLVMAGTTVLSGLVSGISKVAYSEVISSKLTEARRGDLILLNVLWIGSSILAAAAIVAVFIGPVAAARLQARISFRETYREGVETARSQAWFRSYVVIQPVFVPVSLGTSFYSIHASVNHGDTAGSLYVLVVSSSIGLMARGLHLRNRVLPCDPCQSGHLHLDAVVAGRLCARAAPRDADRVRCASGRYRVHSPRRGVGCGRPGGGSDRSDHHDPRPQCDSRCGGLDNRAETRANGTVRLAFPMWTANL